MRSTLHYIGLHPTTTKKKWKQAYSGYSTLKQEENCALKSFMQFLLKIMLDWLISQLKLYLGLNTWQHFWGENFKHLTTNEKISKTIIALFSTF